MRFRGNIKRDFSIFLLQLKNIRFVFPVPLAVNFVLIPVLLVMTMDKFGDISYVEEHFALLTQYFVPVLATWWVSFAFIDMVEGKGKEIHYIGHRLKDNLLLLWFALYMLTVAAGCMLASVWIENAWLEFIRMAICSFFYLSLAYAVMFWSHSVTVSFLITMVYWMNSVFGKGFIISRLNCYDVDLMSMELLSQKYVYILPAALALYAIGYVGNKKKL